jgi:LytS/YehU family sensor histidine kinase
MRENDGDRASAYLTKFARLMRLVLENSRQAEVPLKDDLEALDLYLNLERARSRDANGCEKFDYTITVDPGIDQEETFVPPLVIQPFVENAIWHGMAGKETKGHITLSVTRRGDDLVMAIEDDGVGRLAKKAEPLPDAPVKKTSLATTITKARLDLVQKQKGKPAGFRIIDLAQGTRVEVSLPVGEAA